MFLAGDIGGTKAALAFSRPAPAGVVAEATSQAVTTRGSPRCWQRSWASIRCVPSGPASASPARSHTATWSRPISPWVVDAAGLSEALGGIPVTLLNDLEAGATACLHCCRRTSPLSAPEKPERAGTRP